MKLNRGTSAAIASGFDRQDELTSMAPRQAAYTDAQRLERMARESRSRLANSKRGLDISSSKEFKLQELALLSVSPIFRSIQHWWLQRAERHYLICADVEQQRAREAQMNVAYYQKRAALARSART
jgi:heme exporter protein D